MSLIFLFVSSFFTTRPRNIKRNVANYRRKKKRNIKKKNKGSYITEFIGRKLIQNALCKKVKIGLGLSIAIAKDFRPIRNFYTREKQDEILKKHFEKDMNNLNDFRPESYNDKYLINNDFKNMLENFVDIKNSYYNKEDNSFYINFKKISLNGSLQSIGPLYNSLPPGKANNDEKELIIKKGYNGFFNGSFAKEQQKNNVISFKSGQDMFFHGGVGFFGSIGEINHTAEEGIEQHQKFDKQLQKLKPNQTDRHKDISRFKNIGDYEKTLQELICYELLLIIGSTLNKNQENYLKIERKNLEELGTALHYVNKIWFGDKSNSSILSDDSELKRNFFIRFKTKGFGYIERENSFCEINKEAAKTLEDINQTYILNGVISFLFSLDTMILFRKKTLGFDFLINGEYTRKKDKQAFIGKNDTKDFNFSFGFLVRLTWFENKRKRTSSGFFCGPEICIFPTIIGARVLINRTIIEKFIKGNLQEPKSLDSIIDSNGTRFRFNLGWFYEYKNLRIFVFINVFALCRGVFEIRPMVCYNTEVWHNSKNELRNLIKETKELENNEYLEKLQYAGSSIEK